MSVKQSSPARIVKVPFPVALIRRMDESIIGGHGGFRTRAELMQEAVENLLNELDYPEAPEIGSEEGSAEPPAAASGTPGRRGEDRPGDLPELPDWEREELNPPTLAATALRPLSREPWMVKGNGGVPVHDAPLLGLHNRDYVSLWALHRLARYTTDGPIEFDEYLGRVTRAAWYYASRLLDLEQEGHGQKLTVLLPTNLAKRPSAERGFQSFAVGGITRRAEAVLSATGPLFTWRAIKVASKGPTVTGLTPAGHRLLVDLAGISLQLPHAAEAAKRFLTYLADHAPADRWGFDHLLRAAAAGPDREGLVQGFATAHPEWTAATASSVAQGYVARAREWGLLEPRLVEGRYWLTEIGREVAEEIERNR